MRNSLHLLREILLPLLPPRPTYAKYPLPLLRRVEKNPLRRTAAVTEENSRMRLEHIQAEQSTAQLPLCKEDQVNRFLQEEGWN